MKKLCFSFLMIVLLCLAGYFNPASAQDQRNSGGAYSQYMQGSGGRNSKAPSAGGNAIQFRDAPEPVGPGLGILIGLSLCYLSYRIFTQSKKEEK